MEVHIIGHASIFVKTKDCRILMDPVLWDPHQEGLFDVCPKREVLHERLPEFDFLVISHKHMDHFDIRSLASLPKTVKVLIPKDNLIESCLRKLGYSRIHALNEFSEVKVGSTRMWTTRSENLVPEFGMVFVDESGVLWNQVDTSVRPSTIDFVLSRYSSIDFLLASWQPMLELNYQFNQGLSFPYSEYGAMLYNVGLIRPQAVAPGSNGFKYLNGSSWLNQIVFPVTREQYCRDVKLVCPDLGENVFALDPGDVLIFGDGQFHHLAGRCDYVKKVTNDRDSLDFSPVRVGYDLKDDMPENNDGEVMREAIIEEVEFNLTKFINENELLFKEHRRWKVIYQLEVVFPDGAQTWVFDFSEEKIRAQPRRNPLANLFAYITASSLYGILTGTKGWDYAILGGYYRRYHKIYSVSPLGLIRPDGISIPDPLELRFPCQQVFQGILNREIEKWIHFDADHVAGKTL